MVSNTGVHGGASGHDGVGIKILTDVNIALHDGVVGCLMDAAGFHSKEGGLEECLWAAETLIANGDDLAIGKLIGLLKGGGGSSSGHLLFKVKTNNGVGKGITFIDGNTVGDTISRVHDNTSGTARGIEGEDSLDGNIHSGHVEGLEHDLGHLLT